MYALRDASGTVESIELTAASIMSMKLAAGTDCCLFDCKIGSGAFFKDKAEAMDVAEKMIMIGNKMGKKAIALLTNMD